MATVTSKYLSGSYPPPGMIKRYGGLEPNFDERFDGFTGRLNPLRKYDFGSAKVSDGFSTVVTNGTDLAVHFDPTSQNAGTTIINKEDQRYNLDFAGGNHVFTADFLELTATLNGTLPAGVTTVHPAVNVSYSRTVTVADASLLKVGQLVGYGAEGYANMHRMDTMSITTPGVGDVISLLLTHALTAAQGGFDPITITVTSAGVALDDAASFVSQINANSTLQAAQITAIAMPGASGAFLFSFPKYSASAPRDYGNAGKNSLNWLDRTFSRTGTATLLTPQRVGGVNYILAKSGNTLTLAHPVTLTTASNLTFNPVYMMEINFTGTLGGVDRAVNGGFDTDTDWGKGVGCTIAGGLGVFTASSGAFTETIAALVTGLSCTITYTVVRVSGSVRPSVGGTNGTSRSTSATFTESITCGATQVWAFTGTTFTGSIDNVTLKFAGSYIVQDVSNLSVGMVVQCSFQDSNLRRILNVDATNKEIVVAGAPFMQKGHWLTAYPIFQGVTNSTIVASDTLSFAAVPAGVAIGHQYLNYFGTNSGNIKVIAVTATTVQLDTPVSSTSGDTIMFTPPILSGQIWSKFLMAAGMDNRDVVAGRMRCFVPDPAHIGSFPSFWTFTATDDPNPTSGGGGTSETDFHDVQTPWNNRTIHNYLGAPSTGKTGTMQSGSTSTTAKLASTENQNDDSYVGMNLVTTGGTGTGQTRAITAYNGATRVATVAAWSVTPDNTTTYRLDTVDLYLHPDWSSGSLLGNNFGTKEHEIAFVMTKNRAYFYLDNLLIRCTAFSWNTYKRGQFAANLCVGSTSTSFNSNGMSPVDFSQFPMKYKIRSMEFWAAPSAVIP